MRLDLAQRRRVSAELRESLRVSGLTYADVCRDLGLSPEELVAALEVAPTTDAATLRSLRDHLASAIGGEA